jgi:leader peptidase (prepilin peptidase)/N-methyltransferase
MTEALVAAMWCLMLSAVLASAAATAILRAEREIHHGGDGWRAAWGGPIRSRCDGCGVALAWWRLAPVAGFALAGGRCACGRAAIDPVHPVAELAAVGATGGALAAGLDPVTAVACGVGAAAAAALSLVDLRRRLLPDVGVLVLAGAGIVAGLHGFGPATGWTDRGLGALCAAAGLWMVGALIGRWRGRAALGGGDIKTVGAIGLWVGAEQIAWVVLVAAVGTMIAVLIAVARGRPADQPWPFGPGLLAAGLLVVVAA